MVIKNLPQPLLGKEGSRRRTDGALNTYLLESSGTSLVKDRLPLLLSSVTSPVAIGAQGGQ